MLKDRFTTGVQPGSAALTRSAEEMSSVGYRLIDELVGDIEGPGGRSGPRSLIRLVLGSEEPPPEEGMPPGQALELARALLEQGMAQDRPPPSTMASSPVELVGSIGDALASGCNIPTSLVRMSPAANQIELLTLEWLSTLCGLAHGTSGVFVSSASAGAVLGITLAREQVLGKRSADQHGARLYCSAVTHPAIDRGARVAGLGRSGVCRLPVDNEQRLDLAALERTIQADRLSGLRPFCVVANAGTTPCGAVDDLPALARLCRDQGLWLHVEGQHGAAAAIGEHGRRSLQGLECADSLMIDPQKWLYQPFELCCLFVRRPDLLDETFRQRAFYLNCIEAPGRPAAFHDGSLEGARKMKALMLWVSLRTCGAAASRRAIDHALALAQAVEHEVRTHRGWQVVTPAQLAIVTFRHLPAGIDEASADDLQRRLCTALSRSGLSMSATIDTAVVAGRVVLRMCTIHRRASEAELRGVVRWLAQQAAD